MKTKRQKAILDFISKQDIDTQEELQLRLRMAGFEVTQATISRDIRELGLVKTASGKGKYKYIQDAAKEKESIIGKFSAILTQAMQSVDYAKNLVVIKTFTGMGGAAGAAVDSMELQGVIGSLAGDDTLLVITRDDETAVRLYESFNGLLRQND